MLHDVVSVAFESAGETLAGDMYVPAARAGVQPAVVVAGAWATVKEQMAAGYARGLAARGFVALAFDFRTFGQSGGRQRSMEDPFAKAADIVAAAEFLAHHPAVDGNAIAALGICAGAGYVAEAATRTTAIKSVALVAPALPSRAVVLESVGGERAMSALIEDGQRAQEAYERDGSQTLTPAVDPTPNAAGAEYYLDPNRGGISQWDNTFNVASWPRWAQFDAQAGAKAITQPVLIVHSEAAVSPESVREFVAKVSQPVKQVWLPGVTQFEFYDQAEPMKAAVDAAAHHFAGLRK